MSIENKSKQAFNDVINFHGPLFVEDVEYMQLYSYWLNTVAVKAD